MHKNLTGKLIKSKRAHLMSAGRKRLTNSRCSVFSSNCVGGVICHDLGLRFNSPTVNLYFLPSDFVRFAKHPERYLKARLIENTNRTSLGYPVGVLIDIEIRFMHYKSFDEARESWERRSKRVDLDNARWIMVDRDGATIEDVAEFLSLGLDNHVVLSGRKEMAGIPGVEYRSKWTCKDNDTIDLCAFESKIAARRYIDEFDYISFMNGNTNANQEH